MEKVILVDAKDNAIGTMDKMEAHYNGALHRAFSILLFNADGEILLQKRSPTKYHSGGLWTNTCCSHPRPEESMEEALRRKLKHEMGIAVDLQFAYKFIYNIKLDKNLIENEFDHVYVGTFNGQPSINPEEVEEWKFMNALELRNDIKEHPDQYTYWFRLIMNHPQTEEALGSRQ
jgi:isopentenyl-diphosphate delta-isomerase